MSEFTKTVVAWDCYTSVTLWNGEVVADAPFVDKDGFIHFVRHDGEIFLINASTPKLQYVHFVQETDQ